MPDADLVAAVRAGDGEAFEELYRRYEKRIKGFVRRMVRDPGRAEDVTQEVFFAALRRLRATEGELAFKPWIYRIARNASIDCYRRASRAEEVPIEEETALSVGDRTRLVSALAPDALLNSKQRLEHLRGALEELPDSHNRIIVLRELEGLSYREIAERMEMSRGGVESTLFRARRRLAVEFSELDTGRRCIAVRRLAVRQAEGTCSVRERLRLDRHLRRCPSCARHARSLGVEPLGGRARARVAALLPLPALLRGRSEGIHGTVQQGAAVWAPVAGQGTDGVGALLAKSAALLAAAAMAASGAALGGGGPIAGQRRLDRDRAIDATIPATPTRSAAERAHKRSAAAGRPAGEPARGGRRPARRSPREGVARVRPAPPPKALSPRLTPPTVPSVPEVLPSAPKVRVPAIRPPVAALAPPRPKLVLPRVHTPSAPKLPALAVPKPPPAPEVGANTGVVHAAVGTVSRTGGALSPLARQ